MARAADRWGSRLQDGAESGLETGPPSGRGEWGSVQAPNQWGWGSPLSLRFGLVPLPSLTTHIQGLTQQEKYRSSFQNILMGKKNQLGSPTPRQQVPYKSGPWASPSSAGEGPDPWGPPGHQGERGFILLLLRKPRSVSVTCALKQSSSPRGSSGPLWLLKKEGPPLCAGCPYPQCRTPEARPQRGVPAASQLY